MIRLSDSCSDFPVLMQREVVADIFERMHSFEPHAADEGKLEKTRAGTINRDWVFKTLEQKEFEILDEVYDA